MVGYIAFGVDLDRPRTLPPTLLDAPVPSRVHRERGFAVGVDMNRRATANELPSADLAVTTRELLAFEGYLADLEIRDANTPAQWLIGEYGRKGLDAFARMNGAYAFCLFDRRTRDAWIGACPFGRRDLYYAVDGASVVFSTDLDSVVRMRTASPDLDAEQLTSSFLGGALYGNATLLRGVQRALPGTIVHLTAAGPSETSLVRLAPACEALAEDDVVDELDRRLRTATLRLSRVTERRLVLMSAGLDSSVTAATVKAVTGALQTLTLQTPPDETDRSRAIAEALGSDHHVVHGALDTADLVADFDRFIHVMEEPVLLGLGLPMMTAARHGRQIANGFFCGLGGDTLFAATGPAPSDRDSVSGYITFAIDPSAVSAVVSLSGPDRDSVVPALRARFADDIDLRFQMLFELRMAVRFAARLARFHDGEALSPYLDRDVVDAALSAPPRLLAPSKPLLRLIAARHYNPELQQRGKVGFTASPIAALHVNGRLDPLLDVLEDARTRWRGVYHQGGLRRLVDAYHAGPVDAKWDPVLWQVLAFELFCRRFVDRPPVVDSRRAADRTVGAPVGPESRQNLLL